MGHNRDQLLQLDSQRPPYPYKSLSLVRSHLDPPAAGATATCRVRSCQVADARWANNG